MPLFLDEIELSAVQNIRTDETRALVKHRMPGLEGDVIQDLGRHPTRISFNGILTGDEALANIEKLRQQFKAREPITFISDITGSTDVTDVVIEKLRKWEEGGKPNRYAFSVLLKENVKIMEEEGAEGEGQEEAATEAHETQESGIDNGTMIIEARVELEEGTSDYSSVRVDVRDQEGNTVETIIDQTNGIFRSQPIPAGEYTIFMSRE